MCDGDKQCYACSQNAARTQDTGETTQASGLNLFQYLFGPIKTDNEVSVSNQVIIKLMLAALIVIVVYFIIKKVAK